MTPKIGLWEFDLGHKVARKWKAEYSPTLLFNPDTHHIRWLGAPVGEEARTFLQAVIMLGTGETNLGEQARKILQQIDTPRHIKLFVSPTCPYCPQQAVNALMAAIERPDMISLEIIDIQANPGWRTIFGPERAPDLCQRKTHGPGGTAGRAFHALPG